MSIGFHNDSWNNTVKFLLATIKFVVSAIENFSLEAPCCAQYKVRVFLRRSFVQDEDCRRPSEESRPFLDIELQSEISVDCIS